MSMLAFRRKDFFKQSAAAAFILAAVQATDAQADFLDFPEKAQGYLQTGEKSRPYLGFYDFCATYLGECKHKTNNPSIIKLTPKLWNTIINVNIYVNKTVIPMTDEEQYGEPELWRYPTAGFGDCEDFALQKRKLLIERGFPRSALLLFGVTMENKDGHMLLLVRTDKGDFALDNFSNVPRPAKMLGEVGYTYSLLLDPRDSSQFLSISRYVRNKAATYNTATIKSP